MRWKISKIYSTTTKNLNRSTFNTRINGNDVRWMVFGIQEKFVIGTTVGTQACARANRCLFVRVRAIIWLWATSRHFIVCRFGIVCDNLVLWLFQSTFCLFATNILGIHCHEAQNEQVDTGSNNCQAKENKDET